MTRLSKGATQPSLITKSLRLGPSPAMFPMAHTACSATFCLGEESNFTKGPTAPAFTTAFVCSGVPDATFVKAQQASNWRSFLKLVK